MQTSVSTNGIPEISGYEMLEKIGEGGMGQVYRAHQLSLQRTVAVKFIELHRPTPPQGQPPDTHGEAQVLASLNHPNVVTIHDCGQTDGRFFLVMEYVSGPTLRSLMKPGEPWPVAKAGALVDAVAQALTYIHGQNVLHLDLKPENIMRDSHGAVKITDFGLASTHRGAGAISELEAAQGTLDYSPPEQVHGLGTDQRSDLFSLATIAYELLTGKVPGRAYVPASLRNRRLSSAVDEVLRRGLARDPDERFATIQEFRQAFRAALGLGKPKRSYTLVLMGLLGVVAILAIPWWVPRPITSPAAGTASHGAWFIYDEPEELTWFGGREGSSLSEGGATIKPLQREQELPAGQLPLPVWPEPRPVLAVSTPPATGIVHLAEDPVFGRRVLKRWPEMAELAPSPGVNWLKSGDFTGPVLGRTGPDIHWIVLRYKQWVGEDRIELETPADQPDNQALLLAKNEIGLDADYQLICYQLVSEKPERVGTPMVLRYRARAEAGDGRLSVSPHHAVMIPKNEESVTAARLRRLAETSTVVKSTPEEDGRLYKLSGWVTPTREWRTYCVIWEWPAFGKNAAVVITYAGLGKVWVDDLELFTWELESSP